MQHASITDDPSSEEACFNCLFIPGDTMSGCRIQYSSSETSFCGNLTIGITKHCQILYTGIDNDSTDDDTAPVELITSEYVIKAYDIDYNDVAAVESVANITVTNTTSPTNTSNDPSTTKPSSAIIINTTTDDTIDIPSE